MSMNGVDRKNPIGCVTMDRRHVLTVWLMVMPLAAFSMMALCSVMLAFKFCFQRKKKNCNPAPSHSQGVAVLTDPGS